MARIVLADDGINFDGKTIENKPLGGVESSVVFLFEELARRGHEVTVCNNCDAQIIHNSVKWSPITNGLPENADLYIANRGDKLLKLMPKARRRVFWIHNPARYLMKWRYLSKLWQVRPVIVFIGKYHATTYPCWAPDGGRKVIPYGIPEMFLHAESASKPPPPKAIFTSNPLRSLDWLLDLWGKYIHPVLPEAELHLFTGAATYGKVGDAKQESMAAVLAMAHNMKEKGVVVRGPVPKSQLMEELRTSRVMLYRGDLNETFCLAVGEAQAMGVPTVVQNLGSVVERVIDGQTGFIAENDAAFVASALKLLGDDDLWNDQHRAALNKQRRWGWPQAAAAFEDLMCEDIK